MATIKRHILAQNDLMRRHGTETVKREYIGKTAPRKKQSLKQQINLGDHENHEWQPVLGSFGPHQGKVICNTCNGKFVTWLSKQHIRLICQ